MKNNWKKKTLKFETQTEAFEKIAIMSAEYIIDVVSLTKVKNKFVLKIQILKK